MIVNKPLGVNWKDLIPEKPSTVIWTDEQWNAIYVPIYNVLISAGAGSGKTAVLKTRVIELLKSKISLRNLIILTFTNAAAAEMKERIRKALKEELDKNPTDEFFSSEYDYIDQANIQTFDSLFLEIVKKYHYVIGVSKDVNICDESLIELEKRKIVDRVFNDYYEASDEVFKKLISLLCVKDDKELKSTIIKLDNKLDLLVNRKEYLASYEENYLSMDAICNVAMEYLTELKKLFNEIKCAYKEVKEKVYDIKNPKLKEDYLKGLETFESAFEGLKDLETFEDLNSFKLGEFRFKKIDENIKNYFVSQKNIIKNVIDNVIKKKMDFDSLEKQIELIYDNKDIVLKVIEIINKVNSEINEVKNKKCLYSFMDISKMAIRILETSEDIRTEIKFNTKEIMVDEYQDTSDIQEHFVSLISNNNVYMVGDIKQSIYRFRNANPDIFSSKYNLFKENDEKGIVIDLAKNFRSRKEVLDDINKIFEGVMDKEFGAADYNNGHRLIHGNSSYLNSDRLSKQFKLCTYDLELDPLEKRKSIIEANIIAREIKERVENEYEVYNPKSNSLVPIKYGDFCILTSSKTHYDAFKRVFESYGIPLRIHKDEKFICSNDVVSVISILRVIILMQEKGFVYNPDFKFYLMSMLRSFIFNINDNTINDIFISSDFYLSFKEELPNIFDSINKLSRMYNELTLKDFVDEVFDEFNIFGEIYKLENIESVENRLYFLLAKAEEFSKIGFTGIDFVNYLDDLNKYDIDIKLSETKETGGNVVNLMTIHKSKGLEFNYCYFPLLDEPFALKEVRDLILFDFKLGFIFPIFSEGLQKTFYRYLLELRLNKENISEKIRLFYVALTRAREKFTIVTKKLKYDMSDLNADGVEDITHLVSTNSYLKKIRYNSFHDILTSIYSSIRFNISEEVIPYYDEDVESYKKIPRSFEKVEFRELNIEEKKVVNKKASIETNRLLTKEEVSKMEFGTTVHKYLELIDFNNYEKEIKLLNLNDYYKNKLLMFFKNLASLNLVVKKIYHEYEFMYNNGESNVVGVIDLLIETNDGYVVIDYKLGDIEKDGYINQLNTYRDYLVNLTNKKVSCYLYSIIEERFKIV